MTKKIIRQLGIFLVCGAIAAPSMAQRAMAQRGGKPNILFVLTDDLGYGDIGVFYQNQRRDLQDRSKPWMRTPHLDSMAWSGAIFTSQYSSAPVCAPSRASLVSGLSQGHANVRDNQFDKAIEDNYNLANLLKASGYSTAAIGKWGLQGTGDEHHWPAKPSQRGFDYFYGYMRHADGHEHYPKEGPRDGPKEVWDNDSVVSSGLDKCYTGDLWTAAAKRWIIAHAAGPQKDKPFFMYLAYDLPHAVLELPTQAYPAGGGLHGGIQWLGENGRMINTASGKIDSWINPDYADATYDDDKNPTTPEVPWPDMQKRYATVIRRLDDQVGDLLALLKDLGLAENTVVVFTSDNGPSIESYLPAGPYNPTFFGSFGPFDGIKRDCWEGGIREPSIARWPGQIKPGTVISDPSMLYDWLPTFCNLAGAQAPVRVDGVSLLPSLTGKGEQQKSLVYVEYYEGGKTPDFTVFAPGHRGRRRNNMQMLRLGDTLGVRYNISSPNDDFELYDVTKDPEEANNLALTGNLSEVQERMKQRVLEIRRPDASAKRPYDSSLIAAVSPGLPLQPGLTEYIYNGHFSWIPQTETLKAASIRRVRSLHLDKGRLHVFSGYIDVPRDGAYTFTMKAGSRAFLKIHDASVLDEDYGYEPGSGKSASILLKKGLHPLRLYYLRGGEGKKGPYLDLNWHFTGNGALPDINHSFYSPTTWVME